MLLIKSMIRFLSALILLCVTSTVHAQPDSNAPALDRAKKKCADLGFKAGTERFGSCVLQLSRNDEPPSNLAKPTQGKEKSAAVPPAPKTLKSFKDCEECPEMVILPAGRFLMGTPSNEPGRATNGSEEPHQVAIAQAFAAGKYEITKAQFASFVSDTSHSADGGCFWWTGTKFELDSAKSWRNTGFAQGANDPVACVSWYDAKAFTQWLSKKTGKDYRLLTESEWEYAARAGTNTAFSFGNGINPQQANYATAASYAGSPTAATPRATTPVGSYPPNAFGLHDMHGNVWEWTADCWNANFRGAPSNGSAWIAGDCNVRVVRGGSWDAPPQVVRAGNRSGLNLGNRGNSFGIRVAVAL